MLTDMTGSLLLWLLVAVGVFWCVGVYNRVMRMRARALDAFGSVEKHLRRFDELVQQHIVPQLSAVTPDALPEDDLLYYWQGLLNPVRQIDTACKAVRNGPMLPAPMADLTTVVNRLQEAWMVLLAQPSDLAGSAIPDGMLVEWDEVNLRMQMARGAFNQLVDAYNEALHQFPAGLVVSVMGFRPAANL